jgi:hypothetical protein
MEFLDYFEKICERCFDFFELDAILHYYMKPGLIITNVQFSWFIMEHINVKRKCEINMQILIEIFGLLTNGRKGINCRI